MMEFYWAASLCVHQGKLDDLDALPRPRDWEEEGSAAYHSDAVRFLSDWIAEGAD